MCKHACVLVLVMCCSLAEKMLQAHVMISLASCGMVFELDAGFVQRLRCIFQASQGDNRQGASHLHTTLRTLTRYSHDLGMCVRQ